MAKFKCLISGNIIELIYPADIDSMKGHEGYVEVVEEQKEEKPVKKDEDSVKIPKFRGK